MPIAPASPSIPAASAAPAASAPCCAEVRAHDRVMRYRRSGTGPYLLALGVAGVVSVGSAHLEALSGAFRVLVPELPPDAVDDDGLARWLCEFVEGLGLPSVTVLACGEACVAAVELALSSDSVARLVLLPQGGGREGSLQGRLESATSARTIPVTIVRGAMQPRDLVFLMGADRRAGADA